MGFEGSVHRWVLKLDQYAVDGHKFSPDWMRSSAGATGANKKVSSFIQTRAPQTQHCTGCLQQFARCHPCSVTQLFGSASGCSKTPLAVTVPPELLHSCLQCLQLGGVWACSEWAGHLLSYPPVVSACDYDLISTNLVNRSCLSTQKLRRVAEVCNTDNIHLTCRL